MQRMKGKPNSKNGNGNGKLVLEADQVRSVIYKARRGPGAYVFPVELAEEFGRVGLTHQDMANILGVALKTVQREFNRKTESEFVLAYKRGEANLRKSLKNKLLNVALSDTPSKGQVTALIFALKNYCGMADKKEVEHDGKIEVEVTMGGKTVKGGMPAWLKEN